MITFFRRLSETWIARIFFAVLVGAFALWGIGDVVRNASSDSAIATVGNRKIEASEFQEAFRRDMQQVSRMMGAQQPTPAIRRTVAQQTLDQLIFQAALAEEVQRLGLAVPDSALRQAVTDAPAFHGANGQFDRNLFNAALRNNGLTEQRFFELSRGELAQGQMLGAIQAGIIVPPELVDAFYRFQNQTRVGEVVELPFSAASAPPAPTADDLRRQYENDPARYSAPEYRQIKVVVLAPSIVAKGIDVSDADAKAYYDQHPAEFHQEGKRAAEVIAAPSEAAASALAAAWKGGADWAAMQKQAADAHASAITLDPSTRSEIPSPELADAIFAAQPDTVSGPVKSVSEFLVFRVTKVDGAVSKTFDQAKADIKTKLAQDRALDEVFTRANKLDDALSAGTSLDEMPGDLGLAGLTGTLDKQGMTPQGEPAPLPGSEALKQAIVKTAFDTAKGDPPHMLDGPDNTYYALQVENVTPAKVKPFDEVKTEVAEDWVAAQRRHEQNEQAAKLMVAAQKGGSLDDAATVAGLRMDKTPPVTRTGATEGVAPQVQQAMFGLKQGDTTMVETPEGFDVVRLAEIHDPDPAKDPMALDRVREALGREARQDVLVAFANALRQRAQPRVNPTLLNSLIE